MIDVEKNYHIVSYIQELKCIVLGAYKKLITQLQLNNGIPQEMNIKVSELKYKPKTEVKETGDKE